jgi:thioredoxin 2
MSEIVVCASCGAKVRVPTAASGVPRCPKCHAPTPWLVSAGDADFPAVTDTSVPVLVDLWAPWCGPCKMVGPVVEQLARDNAGRLKVVKVNVDNAPRVAGVFDARSIPTLVVIRDGKVVARQVGALPAPALVAWVENATA